MAVEDQREVTAFADELEEHLELEQVRIEEPIPTPAEAFDRYRKQYKSDYLLNVIEERYWKAREDRVLGLTSADIFTQGTNFIFGEARCPGKVALISSGRLRLNAGLDGGGPGILLDRLLKTAVHELGHTLGALHCPRYQCVMYFSNSLADTDRKGTLPCNSCAGKLSA